MLPPFQGERMQAYESTVRDIALGEIDSWSGDAPFALQPRMQAVTLEVILRAVFGVTDEVRRQRLLELLPQLLVRTAAASLQFRVLLSRRFTLLDPLVVLRLLVVPLEHPL